MKTDFSTSVSPASAKYWYELKDLSNNVKLELITLLSSSMSVAEADTAEDKNWTKSFAGKWQDDRTSDEIIDDIRASRKSFKDSRLG
jgi:hypothetical protein